jgi:hypothetical protein
MYNNLCVYNFVLLVLPAILFLSLYEGITLGSKVVVGEYIY